MYLGIAGACAEQAANASTPLALSISDPGGVMIIVPPGVTGGTSTAGEIVSVATATGGDGSYTYSWSISEVQDPDGAFAVASQGTTNAATYDTATVSTTFGVPPPPNPPPPPPTTAEYLVECTVTDGTGATVTDNQTLFVDVG